MHSTERPESLARALAADVPQTTRDKGASYFRAGAVASLVTFKDRVVATVRGTREYEVELAREQDGFIGSCQCPFFQDRFVVCKHIWAVILAADQRGVLPPVAPRSWIEPVDSPGEHEDPEFAPPAPVRQPGGVRREPWQVVLDGLAQHATAREAAGPVSRHTNTLFLYVIETVPSDVADFVPIEVLGRRRKKNGEWGKPQPAGVGIDEIDELADDADREILALLNGAPDTLPVGPYYASSPARARFRLGGPLLDRVLPLIAETGRLHVWDTAGTHPELVPLEWDGGPPWTFRLDVSAAEKDEITVGGALLRGATRMELPAVTFLISDRYLVARRRLAKLDAGGAASWLRQLRNTAPIRFPQTAAPQLVEALAHARVPPESLPGELHYGVVQVPPQPRVRVRRASAPNPYARRDDLEAIAEFEYDTVVVPADGRASTYDPARRRLIVRAAGEEAAALTRLQQLGFRRAWSYEGKRDDLLVAVEGFPRAVRTLVREGWYVEADGRAFRAPRALDVQVKSGIDWFELHGRADFGDGRTASIADLLAALRRGEGTIVLDDGTRGMVPEEWLERYLRLASFGEAEGDHVRYRRTQTALLDALLEMQPAVSFDEAFARARAELKTFSGIRALNPPETFEGTLREYQREALGWFEFLRRFGFGGCLADDMGLGKTVMVLALLEARRDERCRGARVPGCQGAQPSLVVVPRSLVFNWKDEAARFAPELRVLDYTGAARNPAAIPEHDLVLTTYGTLRHDAPRLTEYSFDYVVLDEAQAIKNAATAAAKAVRLLRGRHRLALSGTPIENHVGELWSLFDFLNPGLLGTARAFKAATAVQGRGQQDDLALVTQAVRPFILRRTKAQVEPQLPPRTEQTIGCELDAPQRRFYDDLRAHYRATLLRRVARSGLARSRMQVLEALLRLRQAACHPGLVDARRIDESSAKLDALLPQLAEVVEEGHKALVFSQFTSFLALVRNRLDEQGLVYEYLDGQTRDREARVHRFNTDERCRVFLISLKAGGVGLNLTAAEYVFLLDPWWNPAVEAQAIDRAHRIGQEKHVFAYRLIAQDTVEEKVAQLQQSKRELADAILTADPALVRNLSADDLDWLLS